MKKFLAILLAALMVLSLAACTEGTTPADNGTKPAESQKEDAEPADEGSEEAAVETVKVSFGSSLTVPNEEATTEVEEYINDYIANTLGINDLKIDLDIYANADFATQLSLMLAGGDELDIISSRDLPTYVANGYMVDVTEYKDTLLKGAFEELGDWMIGTKVGDAYYGIPVKKGLSLAYKFFYDHALFDDVVNIDDITDIDSLGDAMAKLKEVYPDEHFLVYLNQVVDYYKHETHTCNVGTHLATIGDDPTLVNYYATEAFEKGVRKSYEWNNLGYCDPEGTSNTQGHDALVLSGSSKGVLMSHAYSEETCDLMFDMNSDYKIDFGCKTLWTTDLTNTQGCIGIAYTSKHPEAAARMLNLIYTDEFIISAIVYGKEGVSWQWKDDTHHSIEYPEGLGLNSVPYTCLYCCGSFGNQFNLYGMDGNTSEEDKDFMKQLCDEAFVAPYFGFTPDATNVQTQVAAVTNVYNQYNKALLYGELDPDEFIPQYLGELDTAGIGDVLVEYQAQADAWRAANGK